MSKASLELGGGNWGTKDGNLLGYAQGNESSKFIPREFTFTRGSDIAATRINSSGLIEKYRENLLLQSNQFDTTWTTSNASVTSGQSGYDGSSDAWLLESTATTTSMRLQQGLTSSSILSYSIYAKKGTADWLSLRSNSSTTAVWFDLSNGVIGRENTDVIDSSIESIGDGWYRLSVIFSSCTSVRLYVTDGDNVFTTTLGDNIYIQDAQLEAGLVATSYLDSGATTATSGVADNEPRINYAGGTASLLLEPSRTNIVPISEGIPEDINSVTLTENYGTSPEGLQNSLKVQKDGVSSNDRIFPISNYNATLVSSTSYSVSAFVKNIDVTGVTTIGCRLGSGGTLFRLGYEWSGSSLTKVTDYAAGTRTNEILEDYGNGWWRIGFSFEADNTQGGIELDIDRANSSATTSIETYGWQLEEGSYISSYIPDYSGGSVTRNADSFQNSTNDKPLGAIGQGTWFVELQKIGDDTNQAMYLAPTTSNTQQIRLHFDATNARFRDAVNGYATIGGGVNVKTSMTKMALSIDTTSGIAKVYANGSQLGSDYTLQANTFEFSRIVAEGKGFILKQSLFFPNASSNAELAALTT